MSNISALTIHSKTYYSLCRIRLISLQLLNGRQRVPPARPRDGRLHCRLHGEPARAARLARSTAGISARAATKQGATSWRRLDRHMERCREGHHDRSKMECPISFLELILYIRMSLTTSSICITFENSPARNSIKMASSLPRPPPSSPCPWSYARQRALVFRYPKATLSICSYLQSIAVYSCRFLTWQYNNIRFPFH